MIRLKQFISAIIIIFSFSAIAQEKASSKTGEVKDLTRGNYYSYYIERAESNNIRVYGLRDLKDREILPPIFSFINFIDNKYVITNIKSTFSNIYRIDSGFLLPHNSFQELRILDNDLFFYKKDNQFGIIDIHGNIILQNKYGSCNIINNYPVLNEMGYWKLYSIKDNKFLLDNKYNSIERFNDTLFIAKTYAGTNIFNLKGEPLFKETYSNIQPWRNGQFIATQNQKQGIIDLNGNIIIPVIYDYFYSWGDYFRTRLGTLWGIIDHKGKIVLPFKYESIDQPVYGDGYLVASSNRKFVMIIKHLHREPDVSEIYDDITMFVSDKAITQKDGIFHVIEFDYNFDFYYESKGFEFISSLKSQDLNEGSVYNNTYFLFKEGGKYGVLKGVFDITLEAMYDTILYLAPNEFIVKTGNQTSLITASSKPTKVNFKSKNIVRRYKNYFILKDNAKFGVYNSKKDSIVIPCKYDHIIIKNNKFFCFLGTKFQEYDISELKLSEVKTKLNINSLSDYHYYKTKTIYRKNNDYNNQYCLIDNKTNEVNLPLIFSDLKYIKDDLFIAQTSYKEISLYNSNKGFVIPFGLYNTISDIGNGALVVQLNNKYGIIDYEGNLILPLIYDKITGIVENNCDLFKIRYKNREGLYSVLTHQIVIEPQYIEILKLFCDDKLIVLCDSGYQLINLQNKYLFSKYYSSLFAISGTYLLRAGSNDLLEIIDKNEKKVIDSKFKEIITTHSYFDLIITKDLEDKYRIYNRRCELLINQTFDYIDVLDYGRVIKATTGNEFCFYRVENGSISTNSLCHLSEMRDLDDNVLISTSANSYGLVNNQYQIILPFIYDNIYRIKFRLTSMTFSSVFIITQNNLSGVATIDGNIIIPMEYNSIKFFNDGNCFLANKNSVNYLITMNGLVADTLEYPEANVVFTGLYEVINADGKSGIFKSLLHKEIIPCEYEFIVPINTFLYYGYKQKHFEKIYIN